jgi:hypothetical protein
MLHIGYFSFDGIVDNDAPEHGYFSCVVDAEDPKSAMAMFTRHILKLMKENFAFSHIKRIYLEDIIRVNVLPKLPIVTRLQSSKGPFPKSVSYTLPSVTEDGIDAYGLPDDVDSHEAVEGDDYVASTPMIDFFKRRSDRQALQ